MKTKKKKDNKEKQKITLKKEKRSGGNEKKDRKDTKETLSTLTRRTGRHYFREGLDFLCQKHPQCENSTSPTNTDTARPEFFTKL